MAKAEQTAVQGTAQMVAEVGKAATVVLPALIKVLPVMAASVVVAVMAASLVVATTVVIVVQLMAVMGALGATVVLLSKKRLKLETKENIAKALATCRYNYETLICDKENGLQIKLETFVGNTNEQ